MAAVKELPWILLVLYENPELVKQPVRPEGFNQEMRATLKEGREACKTAPKANKVQQQLGWLEQVIF